MLLGDVDARGLTATVESGLVTPTILAFCALRQFQAGELSILEGSVPVDMELDLATGRASVQAPADGAELEFTLAGRRQSVHAPAGRRDVTLAAYELPSQAADLIEALLRTRPAPVENNSGPGPGRSRQPGLDRFGSRRGNRGREGRRPR